MLELALFFLYLIIFLHSFQSYLNSNVIFCKESFDDRDRMAEPRGPAVSGLDPLYVPHPGAAHPTLQEGERND